MNQLLSYQDLFFSVRDQIQIGLPPGIQMITGCRTRGESSRMQETLEFRKDKDQVGMIFYAEDMYMQYLQGAPPSLIASQIAQMCLQDPPSELQSILDYRQAAESLSLRLVNYEKNKKKLSDYVYRTFLDLAVICRVIVPFQEEGVMRTAAVSRHLLTRWEISEDELFDQARECMMRRDAPVLRPLGDILSELAPGRDLPPGRQSDLYVLTTASGICGASAVLFSGRTQQLARELGRDVLVLPSSIHEMLLLPDWGEWEVGALRSIVEDVNRNVVPEEDYLSDNIYRYRLAEDRFVIEE
jgi:hypothetical protein